MRGKAPHSHFPWGRAGPEGHLPCCENGGGPSRGGSPEAAGTGVSARASRPPLVLWASPVLVWKMEGRNSTLKQLRGKRTPPWAQGAPPGRGDPAGHRHAQPWRGLGLAAGGMSQ